MAKGTFKQNTAELFISAAEPKKAKPRKTTAKTKAAPKDLQIPKGYKLVKENKSERLQLLVRPATKDDIKKIAKRQGISVNDLINIILDEYIERQGNV